MCRPLRGGIVGKNAAIVCSIAAALIAVACATQPVPHRETDELAARYVAESAVSGIAISVGIEDEIRWSRGYGYADLEQGAPIDPARTRFRVGSTAKSMTAMALGKLHEAGRIDLDAPIENYLPEYPALPGKVTTRMLAGHLAGIRHYADDEFLSTKAYASVSEALDIFKDDPLAAPPGSRFVYSSYGYTVISAIIESVSGQDYLDYMSEHVFEPVGMSRTVPDEVFPIISDRARPYMFHEGRLINTPWVNNSNKWAGGGFLSTSEDLVRFGLAHLSGEHLQSETIGMLWTSQSTSTGERTGYGIGWEIETDDESRKVIRHSGGSVGGKTELRIYPDFRLVIAVVSNTWFADIDPLVDDVVNAFIRPAN